MTLIKEQQSKKANGGTFQTALFTILFCLPICKLCCLRSKFTQMCSWITLCHFAGAATSQDHGFLRTVSVAPAQQWIYNLLSIYIGFACLISPFLLWIFHRRYHIWLLKSQLSWGATAVAFSFEAKLPSPPFAGTSATAPLVCFRRACSGPPKALLLPSLHGGTRIWLVVCATGWFIWATRGVLERRDALGASVAPPSLGCPMQWCPLLSGNKWTTGLNC